MAPPRKTFPLWYLESSLQPQPHQAAAGLGPARSQLRAAWDAELAEVLAEATLQRPADTPALSTGSCGVHSEHMGFILAEMQSLQRRSPAGPW